MGSGGRDPHRVLGLPRDASEAEIKGAYRSLAKRHHPDAGQGSVVRFLEIQAAYEALAGDRRAGAPSDPVPGSRDAWPRRATPNAGPRRDDADPGPAERRNASGRSSAGPRADTEPGPGRPGEQGGARTGDPGRGRRTRVPRRATLGSTSYDEAEAVFEPDWGGASWYGPSSGTYWTLNPREYADPRKHGPEYQARAHRQAAASSSDGAGEPGSDASARPAADVAPAPSPSAEPSGEPAAEPSPEPPIPPEPPMSAGSPGPAAPGVVARVLGRWRRGRIRG